MPNLRDSNALIGQEVNNLSVPITPAGTDRYALVWVYVYQAGDAPALPTSVTCGGNAMVLEDQQLDWGENVLLALYSYAGPAASLQNVVVTPAEAPSTVIGCIAEAWDDVSDLGTPVGAAVADGIPISLNVSSAAGQVVADGGFGYIGAASFAVGAGQTADELYDPEPGGSVLFASHEAGATTTTMSWGAIDGSMTTIAVPLLPAAGAARSVDSISDSTLTHGQTSIEVGVTGFASTGKTVKICPTDDVNDAGGVAQTVTAQDGDSVTFTAVLNSFAFGTTMYLFVLDAGVAADSNEDGEAVSRIVGSASLNVTLVAENGAAVASQSGITLKIWRADTPSGNASQEITGESTNGSGVLTAPIDLGSLDDGDYVCWFAYRGSPAAQFGAGRKLPTYV